MNTVDSKISSCLLTVNNLTVNYHQAGQPFTAVDNVSFAVKKGETLGIVGESGCGKSSLGLSLIRLIAKKQADISGEILFHGDDILTMPEKKLREIRGRHISMVLQDLTALNPVFSVGSQFAEAFKSHGHVSRSEIDNKTIAALERVNIAAPRERMASFPHQLSGGMRQRVAGAIAMACGPELLIADEPTTALDDTVQVKYLSLLKDIQEKTGIAIVMITHDFGVVASLCDHLCVMYAGQIVEQGSVYDIFNHPAHWYTRGLLASRPSLNETVKRLPAISGSPPDLRKSITGCRFAERCSNVQSKCRQENPDLHATSDDHLVRCFFPMVAS